MPIVDRQNQHDQGTAPGFEDNCCVIWHPAWLLLLLEPSFVFRQNALSEAVA